MLIVLALINFKLSDALISASVIIHLREASILYNFRLIVINDLGAHNPDLRIIIEHFGECRYNIFKKLSIVVYEKQVIALCLLNANVITAGKTKVLF